MKISETTDLKNVTIRTIFINGHNSSDCDYTYTGIYNSKRKLIKLSSESNIEKMFEGIANNSMTLEYDSNDRLVLIKGDKHDYSIRIEYDEANNTSTISYSDGGHETFSICKEETYIFLCGMVYGVNFTLFNEWKGAWVDYTYDNNGRIVCILFSSGHVMSYEYDANGKRKSTTKSNRMFSEYTDGELTMHVYSRPPIESRKIVNVSNGNN